MSESTIPFSRLVRVEWRKAYDTRGSMWLLISIAILVFLAELIATLTQGLNDLPMAWGDFSGIAAFVTSFLLPVLGITLVTQEWGQRTGMVTFALEPRRVRVVMAKWVVGVLLTVATVVFAVVLEPCSTSSTRCWPTRERTGPSGSPTCPGSWSPRR